MARKLNDDGKVLESLALYRNPKTSFSYDICEDILNVDYDEELTTLAEKKRIGNKLNELRSSISNYAIDKEYIERLLERLSQVPNEEIGDECDNGYLAKFIATVVANKDEFMKLYEKLIWVFGTFPVQISKLNKETNGED